MLLKCGNLSQGSNEKGIIPQIARALSTSIRETDITGWYSHRSVLGVIFTEIGDADGKRIAQALFTKISNALCSVLRIDQIKDVNLSFYLFPDDWGTEHPRDPDRSILHIELADAFEPHSGSLFLKRLIDITGSLLALSFLLPLLIIIAALIKLTSSGPVLFQQMRIGQYGKPFRFLKFRSMYFKNDHTIHEQYVKTFIVGTPESDAKRTSDAQGTAQPAVYKLTRDPRVTPFGRILRRTSLDELPQFLNVLTGEMSLVGPRPPVPYELEYYDIWHRQRFLVAKPGITGLWQVEGRSYVTFDDMVRMDLRYARSWSLWLDIKLLLRTPRAMVSGKGAF
jgi:lipopolysaccharide/colanic/teichoic acid biosynthesis glycosyltransferase